MSLIALPNAQSNLVIAGAQPQVSSDPIWISEAVALGFDLPGLNGLQVGALVTPFRAAEFSFGGESVQTTSTVKIGALLTPLPHRRPTLWDRVSEIEIYMPDGVWFAVSETETLAGANRFAIETATGWEIIGAADVTLIDALTYRLKTLLRGLSNSDDMMMPLIPAGARIVALDAGLADLRIDADYIEQNVDIAVTAGGREGVSAEINYRAAHLRPLSVVHLKAKAIGDETKLSWIPRNLDDAESLNPAAQVEISWSDGTIITTETSVQLPILPGAGASVTLTPIDPLGGRGLSKTIRL